MSKVVLIDGDSILYRVAFRGEEMCDVDDIGEDDDGMDELVNQNDSVEYAYSGDHQLHLPSAYNAVDYHIEEISDAWMIDSITGKEKAPTSIEIYMTGKPDRLHCDDIAHNFRIDYVDDYKATRKDSRPPAGLKELWAHIFSITEIGGIPVTVRVCDGCEADDVVVYLKKQEPEKYLLSALDKDVLYQSAGRHYNYGKKEFEIVKPLEAVRYLYFQMIAGDPSDGYKGVPRVGKIGADKALKGLNTPKEMWDATLALYKQKGLGLGEAIQTGILADMHQVTAVSHEGFVTRVELEIFKARK